MMLTKWVLIVFVINSGSVQQEFWSRDQCVATLHAINDQAHETGPTSFGACAPKDMAVSYWIKSMLRKS